MGPQPATRDIVAPADNHAMAAAMLALLRDGAVEFILVGPLAAAARGANIAMLDPAPALDITPEPTPGNLARLAEGLRRAGRPRLRVNSHDGPPVTLDAEVFSYLPVLPITTDIAALTVVLHPLGAPSRYDELLADVSPVEVAGVAVLAPSTGSLLRGLAGGWQQPDPRLLQELHRVHRLGAIPAGTAPPARHPVTDPDTDAELHRAIIEAIDQIEHPASIRDVLLAISGWRPVTYSQTRVALDVLTHHGQLVRSKAGTAHRYRRNTDADDRAAHEVAVLLSSSAHPESVTAQALQLLRHNAI